VLIAILALVLAGAVLWFNRRAPEKNSAPPPAPAVAKNSNAPVARTLFTPRPVPPSPKKSAATNADDSLAVIPISLTKVFVAAENNVDAAMQSLPQGTQVFGGIEFWLEGLVHLQSLATRDEQRKNYRAAITVPLAETNLVDRQSVVNERGRNIMCIYLLAGTRFSSPQAGENFADVVWHFADGSVARSALAYDVHLRDWARKPYESPAQLPNTLTKVAWHGPHPSRTDRSLRLYRVALLNPHPEKIIRALEFESAMKRPSLFVAALTLDPLLPGARPDDLTSAESADPEMNGQLQLYVQDSAGHPLPDAQVTAGFNNLGGGVLGPKFTTDFNGMALVRFPDKDLNTLTVSAEHDDFSEQKMLWDMKSGDTVPASYTLKLSAEVKIGGIVVDESEQFLERRGWTARQERRAAEFFSQEHHDGRVRSVASKRFAAGFARSHWV
jgi:hypothetical protein